VGIYWLCRLSATPIWGVCVFSGADVGHSAVLRVVQDGLSVQLRFCRVRANRTEWAMPVARTSFRCSTLSIACIETQ
jgi:hypothetical protein